MSRPAPPRPPKAPRLRRSSRLPCCPFSRRRCFRAPSSRSPPGARARSRPSRRRSRPRRSCWPASPCARIAPSESEATPPADLYEVGTLVMVKRMMRTGDGLQLIVHGTERVRVVELDADDPHLRARVRILPAPVVRDPDAVEALTRNVQALVQRALAMLPRDPARSAHCRPLGGRPRTARLLPRLHPQPRRRAGAEDARSRDGRRPAADRLRPTRARDRDHADPLEDRDRGAERDGQGAARLLPAPADEGDPEGAGRGREGGERAEAEMLRERLDAADLPEDVRKEAERELRRHGASAAGRARLSRHPHVSRVRPRAAVEQVVRRQARPRRRRAASSTKTTTGSKTSRSASSNSSPSSSCDRDSKSPDPLLRRPAGRRQDFPRHARSRARSAASSSDSLWAACATRRSCAATVAPTSARCPAASSSRCGARASTTP